MHMGVYVVLWAWRVAQFDQALDLSDIVGEAVALKAQFLQPVVEVVEVVGIEIAEIGLHSMGAGN